MRSVRKGEAVNIQLAQWQGDFGEQYTRRNDVPWQSRVAALDSLLPRGIESVQRDHPHAERSSPPLSSFRPGIHDVRVLDRT